MQSGITASKELHEAFTNFTSNSSAFALPVTITGESLQPLDPVLWQNITDFDTALARLAPHLQPKTPIFLLLRKSPRAVSSDLIAITYVPSTAPVRSKTLFASTRSTLLRDLGLEKFSQTIFVTDAEEVLDPAQWADREKASGGGGVDPGLLSTEERELQSVKRAEEEERHGTSGRDLMGSGGSGTTFAGSREGTGAGRSGIVMKITDDAKEAMGTLASDTNADSAQNAGDFVQLGIDIATETLTLLAYERGVSPDQVSGLIPATRPSYTFYHFPSTSSTLFIYVCPGTSKVKERMVYASSRRGVVQVAKEEGVHVAKQLEAGEPSEINEERLMEEVGGPGPQESPPASRQGFARPKRPGKR